MRKIDVDITMEEGFVQSRTITTAVSYVSQLGSDWREADSLRGVWEVKRQVRDQARKDVMKVDKTLKQVVQNLMLSISPRHSSEKAVIQP